MTEGEKAKDMVIEAAERFHCLYRTNQKLSHYTSMGVGGECPHIIYPINEDSLSSMIDFLTSNNIGWDCIGAGTNIIARDEGIEKVLIKLSKLRTDNLYNGSELTAHGGYKLPRLVGDTAEKGLSGLEFAAGIPGTVGGAVVMNAGSYGSSMEELVKRVLIMDRSGTMKWLNRKDIEFGYRETDIKKRGIVVKVSFKLVKAPAEMIREKIATFQKKREAAQPVRSKSAGCIFKNPESEPAGKLIDSLGMKGKIFGGARVSELHANYIINDGAFAKDIINLIEKIEDIVYRQKGIRLEKEVEIWG